MPKKWTCNACTYERNKEKTRKTRESASVAVKETNDESRSALDTSVNQETIKEDSVDRRSETESIGPNTPSSSDTITSQQAETESQKKSESNSRRKPANKSRRCSRRQPSELSVDDEKSNASAAESAKLSEYECEVTPAEVKATDIAESVKLKALQKQAESVQEESSPGKKSAKKGKQHRHNREYRRKRGKDTEDKDEDNDEDMEVENDDTSQLEEQMEQDSGSQEQNESQERVGERASRHNGNSVQNDMEVCREILEEMRKHGDAWPFLTPVSSKQFPNYRKVIRTPIDFQTMAKKLNMNRYRSREEFAADARLVFSNCEKFNEDESSIGRAGHSMQQFFNKCWEELTADKPRDSSD